MEVQAAALTDSTAPFYRPSCTFLIETLISLSIHNIFDDETPFDGKRISFASKSLQKYLVEEDPHIRDF